MPPRKPRSTSFLRISQFLYLFLTVLLFYLLILSRTGETQTVWQVLHPAFVPTLFVTTYLLLTIIFTSEKTTNKLFFIMIHSILIHSLFSIIFPAGDLSGQQMILGRTRRVFDNTILHGFSGWPTATIQVFIVELFIGTNLQAALSTIFARTLSIDILYVHLFFIPVLWGMFIPVASFLTAKVMGLGEKASVLSSLLVSAFPYTIYFGAISVPNSLGFIFFFYSLYLMLRHLSTSDSRTTHWMLIFSFFSFLSHYLTGIMSFSLLFLTLAFKVYEGEKKPSPINARILLMVSFVVCVSLLPLSFIYMRFIVSNSQAVFTLDKFYELPFQEIIGLFFLGELVHGFDLKTILLVIVGPALAFLWMIYQLYRLKRNLNDKFRIHICFLFTAFLIILVDYRILKLFMSGLPLNEERLWVFNDFIAAPFVALAIYEVVSSIKAFLKARSPPTLSIATLKAIRERSKALSKGDIFRVVGLFFSGLLFTVGVLSPLFLAGWMTASLSASYPQVAPLQTTWYELEAVKYIEENTHEKYVVIGDIWTIFAGERIVGINNPKAYYFGEYSKIGHDLFVNMSRDPSPQWMLWSMNYTNTKVAYFIVTEPRLGTEEFNGILSKAKESGLQVYGRPEGFGNGKLYVFSYGEE